MSGGYFDYKQYQISEIVDEIERFLSFENDFSEETIKEIEFGVRILKIAHLYAHRIDWLLSGDDAEDDFFRRILDDIEKINGIN